MSRHFLLVKMSNAHSQELSMNVSSSLGHSSHTQNHLMDHLLFIHSQSERWHPAVRPEFVCWGRPVFQLVLLSGRHRTLSIDLQRCDPHEKKMTKLESIAAGRSNRIACRRIVFRHQRVDPERESMAPVEKKRKTRQKLSV